MSSYPRRKMLESLILEETVFFVPKVLLKKILRTPFDPLQTLIPTFEDHVLDLDTLAHYLMASCERRNV